jgi:protein TonB
MPLHQIPTLQGEEKIVISLSEFTTANGDIYKLETEHSQIKREKKPITKIFNSNETIVNSTPEPKTETIIEPIAKKVETQTSKVIPITTKSEGTQSPVPAVSPEISSSAQQQPKATPIKSLDDSPHISQMTSDKKVQINQIGGAALGDIRSMIENAITYPSIARKLRLEGIVLVTFILKPNGTVDTVKVKSSSGSNILDTKAIQTILNLSGDYPALGKTFELSIPIAFHLQKF